MAAYRRFMTHVTCRLTAKNRDQLRNPMLGNRVRATIFARGGVINYHGSECSMEEKHQCQTSSLERLPRSEVENCRRRVTVTSECWAHLQVAVSMMFTACKSIHLT